jgi:hypothetical protein
MSEEEVAVGGLKVRRHFERSRLEVELFEAVYETLLLASAPQEGCLPRLDGVAMGMAKEAGMASVAA